MSGCGLGRSRYPCRAEGRRQKFDALCSTDIVHCWPPLWRPMPSPPTPRVVASRPAASQSDLRASLSNRARGRPDCLRAHTPRRTVHGVEAISKHGRPVSPIPCRPAAILVTRRCDISIGTRRYRPFSPLSASTLAVIDTVHSVAAPSLADRLLTCNTSPFFVV